jgi:hypothetical protein
MDAQTTDYRSTSNRGSFRSSSQCRSRPVVRGCLPGDRGAVSVSLNFLPSATVADVGVTMHSPADVVAECGISPFLW